MTAAQTIQVRLSFLRENLNRLLSIETRSAEEQTEMETLTAEVSAKETGTPGSTRRRRR